MVCKTDDIFTYTAIEKLYNQAKKLIPDVIGDMGFQNFYWNVFYGSNEIVDVNGSRIKVYQIPDEGKLTLLYKPKDGDYQPIKGIIPVRILPEDYSNPEKGTRDLAAAVREHYRLK